MELHLIWALCFAALLSAPALGLRAQQGEPKTVNFRLTVKEEFANTVHYVSVLQGGVLYGALRTLQENSNMFKFTVSLDPNFGLYLESVNGLAGSDLKQTYWQILSETGDTVSELDVGIGCYQPKEDEHIILKYSTWPKQ